MFESVGFQCGTKYMASASKVLSFTKPAGAADGSSGAAQTAAEAEDLKIAAGAGGEPASGAELN